MERTKKAEVQRGFFSDAQLKRTKQGMQSSVDNFVSDINEYMIPRLKEAGYGAKLVRSNIVLKKLQKKETETFGKIDPRLLLEDEGKGWWLEIWPLENIKHKMVVKPCVITSTKPEYLKNHPRLNLTSAFLKELRKVHQNIWIRTIWNLFYVLDLHFLIVTKTGKFWMGKYTDIHDGHTVQGFKPQPCGWSLTYRNNPNKLDRIATKAEVQIGVFKSCSKELRNTILTQIYYFNKNNTYKRNED